MIGLPFCSLMACVEPITVGEMEAGTEENNEQGGSPTDNTNQLVESVTLLRVLPVDSSLDAEIFCVAVPVTPRALITSASCFRGGIKYGEILSGSEVNFYQSGPRIAVVKSVYSHPAYNPNIPTNIGADLAVVHVDRDVNTPLLTPFGGDLDSSISPLVRVGYLPNEELLFRKQVSFGLDYTQDMALLSFIGTGEAASPCRITGAPVLASVDGKASLIAISSYGDVSCTEGGSASLLKQSATFLNEALSEMITLPEGVNAQVQGNLSCSQAFKCFDVSACLAFMGEEASMQYNQLFQCAQAASCENFSCYEMNCPEQFQACIAQ